MLTAAVDLLDVSLVMGESVGMTCDVTLASFHVNDARPAAAGPRTAYELVHVLKLKCTHSAIDESID